MLAYLPQCIVLVLIGVSCFMVSSAGEFRGKNFLYIFFALIAAGMLFWVIPNILVQNGMIDSMRFQHFMINWGIIGGVLSIAAWAMMLAFTTNLKILVEKAGLRTPLVSDEKHCVYEIEINRVKRQVLVKNGFSWPAFFVAPIWAWTKGMVGLGFLLLLGNVVIRLVFSFIQVEMTGVDSVARIGLMLIILVAWLLFTGYNGNRWLMRSLEKKGYVLQAAAPLINPAEPKSETVRPQSVQPAGQNPATTLDTAGWEPIARPNSPDDIVAAVTQSMLSRQSCLEQDTFETGEKNPTRLLCSDNQCPCTDQQPLVIGRTAYLYISPEVVEFRKNCRSLLERNALLEKMASKMGATVFVDGGVANPFYLCETGARQRGLDLAAALADAKMVAETGFAPLRPTPKVT